MELNKEEIVGKALKKYLGKIYCNEIDKMIDIHTFAGVAYSVLEVVEELEVEPNIDEELVNRAGEYLANKIRGRLYKL